MAKQTLFSFEVAPGMVIAEDLYNPKGQLILTKGFVLDEATIAKLEYNSILEVPIDDSPVVEEKPATVSEMYAVNNYSERIKNSEDFKQFQVEYKTSVSRLNASLVKAMMEKDKPIDTDSLYSDAMKMINTSMNSMHIFDIIHNLRDYDDIVSSHSINVALISNILGKWLGFSEEDLKVLTVAGLLHDVGKLAIPPELLNKPGRLTDEEFEMMRSHVKKGYEILRNQDLDIRIKEACLLHHERCDGSGYPFHSVGNRITPFAKIIAIADVYDAMTAARAYRGAFCPFDVIQMFDEEGLNKFDPQYIMTFLSRISSTYIHNNVKLSDGSIGEIIMINQMCLYRPIVRVGEEFIDLIKRQDLKIEAIV